MAVYGARKKGEVVVESDHRWLFRPGEEVLMRDGQPNLVPYVLLYRQDSILNPTVAWTPENNFGRSDRNQEFFAQIEEAFGVEVAMRSAREYTLKPLTAGGSIAFPKNSRRVELIEVNEKHIGLDWCKIIFFPFKFNVSFVHKFFIWFKAF